MLFTAVYCYNVEQAVSIPYVVYCYIGLILVCASGYNFYIWFYVVFIVGYKDYP